MTAGAAARDRQAERDHAEWLGWWEAQGYTSADFEEDDMRDAFTAGMEAARMLAAATGYGTLAERVKRLADAWSGCQQVTEQGQLYRDLGQVLRDELEFAADKPQVTE